MQDGVAKTTSAVTLAHYLAMAWQHTLLVDLDPQGHVAFALDMDKAPGLYKLVVDEETCTMSRSSIPWITWTSCRVIKKLKKPNARSLSPTFRLR